MDLKLVIVLVHHSLDLCCKNPARVDPENEAPLAVEMETCSHSSYFPGTRLRIPETLFGTGLLLKLRIPGHLAVKVEPCQSVFTNHLLEWLWHIPDALHLPGQRARRRSDS